LKAKRFRKYFDLKELREELEASCSYGANDLYILICIKVIERGIPFVVE
jgi:hypothetical protein